MSEQELREIEARLAKATRGPWKVGKELWSRSYEWIISQDVGQGRGLVLFDTRAGAPESELDNARFVANAPTDVAALLAEVKALRAERDAAVEAAYREGWETAASRAAQRTGLNLNEYWQTSEARKALGVDDEQK